MTHKQAHQAFTLVEVMVVIAILLIVAFLLIPTFSPGRQSLTIRCLNNERQIAITMLFYAEEHGRGYPNLDIIAGNDGPAALSLMTNYLRQPKTFMCPFVIERRGEKRRRNSNDVLPELNAAFFRFNGSDYAYYDGLKFPAPTNAILADRLAWTNRQVADTSKANHPRGSINAAFGDGHGQTLKPIEVIGVDYIPAWSAVQDPLVRR